MRGWREEDLDAYAALVADPEVMRFLGDPQDRNLAWRGIAQWIGHWELRGYGLWAVERKSDGVLLGRVGLWNPEGWPGVEVGWALARGSWGQGYAYETAVAAADWAWENLAIERLLSVIASDNGRSRRVAERLGMSVVGTHQFGELEALIYSVDRPGG
jgi:RimJ/RimL family protein N-acetyltransferase